MRNRGQILVNGISGGEQFEAEFDFLINAAGHGAHSLTKSYWQEAVSYTHLTLPTSIQV